MQEVAVTALREYLHAEERSHRLNSALQDTLSRYGTTLKRLGE